MAYPSTRNSIIVIIVIGLIVAGALYWETAGTSPSCGPCWNANPPGCPVVPCPGHEALNIETWQVNSPTNMTLMIRNTGTVQVLINSYSVKDSFGNQFRKTNATEPSMGPNQLGAIGIIIDGNAFTFQSKSTYTVAVTSVRNNIFTFTIIT